MMAYIDDALTLNERQLFESRLQDDVQLARELAAFQRLKQDISRLPRFRAPRNYTLDPKAYTVPDPLPFSRLYPAMQTATVLTAFFFVFALALTMFNGNNNNSDSFAINAPVAEVMEVEVTRVVTETEAEVVEIEGEEVSADIASESSIADDTTDAASAEDSMEAATTFGTSSQDETADDADNEEADGAMSSSAFPFPPSAGSGYPAMDGDATTVEDSEAELDMESASASENVRIAPTPTNDNARIAANDNNDNAANQDAQTTLATDEKHMEQPASTPNWVLASILSGLALLLLGATLLYIRRLRYTL
ncbi:MAG TPA: hypothetical protein VLL52_12325 [Anaerolineae bacterium]|nr:hypothetical protein [Anaerolineae bacterium]